LLWKRAAYLTVSSNVNQIIHNVSIRKKGSVMSGTSSSSIFVPFVVVLNTYKYKPKEQKKKREGDGYVSLGGPSA